MAESKEEIAKEQGTSGQKRGRGSRMLRMGKVGRFRFAMISGFVLLIALILPKDYTPEYSFELGKPWVAPSLDAEFDFALYKSEAELKEEKEQARKMVPPVFLRDTTAMTTSRINAVNAVNSFFDQLMEYKDLRWTNAEDAREMKENVFMQKFNIEPDFLLAEHPSPEVWKSSVLFNIRLFTEKIFDIGVIDTVLSEMGKDNILIQESPNLMIHRTYALEQKGLLSFLEDEFPAQSVTDIKIFKLFIFPNIHPDLVYSEKLTEQERKNNEDKVSAVTGKVAKGETIISRGERVMRSHEEKLNSYIRARSERYGSPPFLVTLSGQIIMVGFITIMLVIFIRNNRPRLFFDLRKLGLVLLVFVIMVSVIVLILKLTIFTQELESLHFIYLAPVCMVAIILSAFFDTRFAFFGNLVIAVFGGAIVPNGFEYFFIQLSAGTAAVYSLTRLRNRADFFISLSLILATYVVTYVGYNFYTKGNFTSIEYVNLALFGINVLLTFITYPLIYLFEKAFGLTSDLTLIELLDTNHPLLKDLSIRAPGTFQHSLQVANIAEAILNRIGGNGLKARVGALFHDIGKMNHPQYFIENLGDNKSPHDKLGNIESAQAIIRHVSDGVDLANKHNLPQEVIDFIKTHHGTTRTEFFYRKEMQDKPGTDVDSELFTYPGPLPFSREMAVLMIADSIEAASRALKDKSPDNLKSLVDNIVEAKVNLRQFDRAALTFSDLETAKNVAFSMLNSIYHGRIEYPEEKKNKLEKTEEIIP